MAASIAGMHDISYPQGTIQFKRTPSMSSLPDQLSQFIITDKEHSMITQIKQRLSDKLSPRYDDIRICRFLRREKEVDKTEAMIRREMKWREEIRPDQIFEEFPKSKYFKSLMAYWPGTFHGTDKYGVPMYCERLGVIDLHSLLGVVPADILVQYHIYCIERNDRFVTEAFQRLGAPVGFVYIMDLDGLSMRHYNTSAIDILKQIQVIDDNYYPELLRKVIVLNAPSVFALFWKLASHIMHKQTVAKWSIMKKDYHEELFSHIPKGNIPNWLGGSCTTCPHHNNGCKFGGDKFHMIE